MDIIKKNLISIVCGVVAILAIVAWQFPLNGMIAKNQEELDKQKGTHQQMETLLRKPRQLPTINVNQTPEPLKVFPSQSIIDQGAKIKEQLTKQSEAMRDAAVAINKHDV